MKKFYFDTETTGLDPDRHDIIQIAGIVEINGFVEEKFCFEVQPFSYDNIEQDALEVHGIGLEKIKKFPKPQEVHDKLVRIFDKYIDKYDRNDKFIVCGYNVRFDIDFLRAFFEKNEDDYLFSYFGGIVKDPYPVLAYLKSMGKFDSDNLKLETVCRFMGFAMKDAHDAMSDIMATKLIIEKLDKALNKISL